jgi:hypothetical protein
MELQTGHTRREGVTNLTLEKQTNGLLLWIAFGSNRPVTIRFEWRSRHPAGRRSRHRRAHGTRDQLCAGSANVNRQNVTLPRRRLDRRGDLRWDRCTFRGACSAYPQFFDTHPCPQLHYACSPHRNRTETVALRPRSAGCTERGMARQRSSVQPDCPTGALSPKRADRISASCSGRSCGRKRLVDRIHIRGS